MIAKDDGFCYSDAHSEKYEPKQNITTKITKNTKKCFIKSFLNFVAFVVYIIEFRIASKIKNGILLISKRI
jgi:hypothetical protein